MNPNGYSHKCYHCGATYYDSDGACDKCFECEECEKVITSGIVVDDRTLCSECVESIEEEELIGLND